MLPNEDGGCTVVGMGETTADQVRTGHVITNDWAAPRLLEVAYPVRERFVNPEGATLDVVRFSGWVLGHDGVRGVWVEAGWGLPADHRAYVVDDMRGRGAFGELS